MLITPRTNLHEPLVDGRTHPSVSLDKFYVVATLILDEFQIVDDDGEPIFVPRSRFEVLDDWIPHEWVTEVDEAEGWFWRGPPEFTVRGFFERWHDGSALEREVFAGVYTGLWRHYENWFGGQEMRLER